MGEYNEQQLKDAARRAYEDGNIASARRLIAAARNAASQQQTAPPPKLGIMPPADAAQPDQPPAAPGQFQNMTPELQQGLDRLSDMTHHPQDRPDEVIAGQTYSPEQADFIRSIHAQPNVEMPQEGTGTNLTRMVKATGSGFARGVEGIANLPNAISGAVNEHVVAPIARSVGFDDATIAASSGSALPGTDLGQLSEAAVGADVTAFEPRNRAERFAGTVGEFLPATVATGPAGMLRYGVVPGLASEAAGQATEGTKAEPYARVAAAMTAPLGVAGVETAARRAISPTGGADPSRLAMAQTLDDAGIPITAGQRTGSPRVGQIEANTRAGRAVFDAQAEAFTKKALELIGTNATRFTPEVVEQTAQRIGAVFDDVTRGLTVRPTRSLGAKLRAADDTYTALAPQATRSPLINGIAREVQTALSSGSAIPASQVSTWRSRLSKLTASNDGATRDAAREAMEAIDDALMTSVRASGGREAIRELAIARKQWRDFLALQTAIGRAGEEAAHGILKPANVRNAIAAQGRAASAQGRRGELGELARAAVGVAGRPSAGITTPTGLAGGVGGVAGGWPGFFAGVLAPPLARGLAMSKPGQAYLGNQLMGQRAPMPVNRLALPAIGAATTETDKRMGVVEALMR